MARHGLGIGLLRCHDLARHRDELGIVVGVAEVHDTEPRMVLVRLGKSHSMDCTAQQTIGPVTQQIADVDQDGREIPRLIPVVGPAAWSEWYRSPGIGTGNSDFQPRLIPFLKQQSYRAIIGVGSSADVDCRVAVCESGERWIV